MEQVEAHGFGRTAVILDELTAANVVHVFGEIDFSVVSMLDDVVARSGSNRPLVVDFTHCRYIDSSVLAALVRVRRARTATFNVVLPEGHRMRRIFAITNLDAFLAVVPDIDSALRSIRAARLKTMYAV